MIAHAVTCRCQERTHQSLLSLSATMRSHPEALLPPAPSVSYDLMADRVACVRRVFPHEGSSGVVAQAGSVLGQTVRVPVFSQERTAVVLGCLNASIINPNQVDNQN